MNVLYLTTTRFVSAPFRDASTRYRCYHPAEALREAGHLSDVSTVADFDLRNLDRYDVVCVLRPSMDRKLLRMLELCDSQGIRTVADVDDLIFDPSLAAHSPMAVNGQAPVAQVRNAFSRHAQIMKQFNDVSTATSMLASAWKACNPMQRVYVVPNGLSRFWLDRNHRVTGNGYDARRITYLPGSRSHDRDFASISSVIEQYLTEVNNAELMVVGSLTLDESAFPKGRISRGRWTEYINLPRIIANSWVTIAPLVNTRFNRAKSHIKFIESAAFGIPLICSPNDDLLRHQAPGLLIAETPTAWRNALESLCDRAYYEQCASQLREYVRDGCMASHGVADLRRYWSVSPHQDTHEATAAVSKVG